MRIKGRIDFDTNLSREEDELIKNENLEKAINVIEEQQKEYNSMLDFDTITPEKVEDAVNKHNEVAKDFVDGLEIKKSGVSTEDIKLDCKAAMFRLYRESKELYRTLMKKRK